MINRIESRLCRSKINDQKQSLHKETSIMTLDSDHLRSRSKTKFTQRSMEGNLGSTRLRSVIKTIFRTKKLVIRY